MKTKLSRRRRRKLSSRGAKSENFGNCFLRYSAGSITSQDRRNWRALGVKGGWGSNYHVILFLSKKGHSTFE